MTSTCPKCQYQRRPSDSHVMAGVCPACGIAYAKWRARDEAKRELAGDSFSVESVVPLRARFFEMISFVPQQVEAPAWWARVVLWMAFAAWGLSFIVGGIDWQSINGSFLHNVNLPFHEFGHVLFGFLGRFMGILGGSLFQILVPLVFTVAFSWQMRDNFAAAITLWWCGQNFIDVAPYIADAPYREMPLIFGLGEEYHDWGNLLSMMGALDSAGSLAALCFGVGAMIMLLALGWAAWLLQRQRQHLVQH